MKIFALASQNAAIGAVDDIGRGYGVAPQANGIHASAQRKAAARDARTVQPHRRASA